jgi:hypothetical protein
MHGQFAASLIAFVLRAKADTLAAYDRLPASWTRDTEMADQARRSCVTCMTGSGHFSIFACKSSILKRVLSYPACALNSCSRVAHNLRDPRGGLGTSLRPFLRFGAPAVSTIAYAPGLNWNQKPRGVARAVFRESSDAEVFQLLAGFDCRDRPPWFQSPAAQVLAEFSGSNQVSRVNSAS